MNKNLYFYNIIASGREITTKERGNANSNVVFSFLQFFKISRGVLFNQNSIPVFIIQWRLKIYIGFLHSFSRPDFIEVIQSGGQQQSNLFPVSAGSDLRMSPLRPNPYLSIGIDERKSKYRGFFQLFSRPN